MSTEKRIDELLEESVRVRGPEANRSRQIAADLLSLLSRDR
jgi:hypothetical protein